MTTLAKYLFGVVGALVLHALYPIDPALALEAPEALGEVAEEAA
jgi:hypothetical protein